MNAFESQPPAHLLPFLEEALFMQQNLGHSDIFFHSTSTNSLPVVEDLKKAAIVYVLYNTENNTTQLYVGKTQQFYGRMHAHHILKRSADWQVLGLCYGEKTKHDELICDVEALLIRYLKNLYQDRQDVSVLNAKKPEKLKTREIIPYLQNIQLAYFN
eukprot:GDKK01020905.1.p1 GENE.GDKK01020905.1~~GDKK01020905.1.p1  ORF type:complete len:184 (+),score=24.40 GDKK01020905.1:81-554(+)